MASDKLIHFVSQHRALYDKQSVEYRDTEYKDRLWQMIAEQLGKQDVEAVKKMWRSLRDTYVCYRKEGQGRSGQGASKKKKWIHMDAMSFLQNSLARRRSDSNIHMDEEEEFGIGDDERTQTEKECGIVVMETESEGSTTPSGSCGAKRKKAQAESEDSLARYCQWKEARDERREKEREAERQQRQAWQELQSDEVSTFLSSLAPCMRRLTPEKLSYLKIKMQQLIHDVAFGGGYYQQFSQDPTYSSL